MYPHYVIYFEDEWDTIVFADYIEKKDLNGWCEESSPYKKYRNRKMWGTFYEGEEGWEDEQKVNEEDDLGKILAALNSNMCAGSNRHAVLGKAPNQPEGDWLQEFHIVDDDGCTEVYSTYEKTHAETLYTFWSRTTTYGMFYDHWSHVQFEETNPGSRH